MRCPECKKITMNLPSEVGAGIRCVFCGAVFDPAPTPKQRIAVGLGVKVAAKPRTSQPALPPDYRPRFINSRYALAPNPRRGGMAHVYRASDMLDENRQVAVKVLCNEIIEAPILAEVFNPHYSRGSLNLRLLCA